MVAVDRLIQYAADQLLVIRGAVLADVLEQVVPEELLIEDGHAFVEDFLDFQVARLLG